MFFLRWLQHPLRLGTFAPISQRFARYVAQLLPPLPPGPVIEIGAGTGRLTRALLAHSPRPLTATNFAAIELDGKLCTFLRQHFFDIQVIEGNARDVAQLIPGEWIGQVNTIISVVPLMYLSLAERLEIVNNCFAIMGEGGVFFQVTYSYYSPLPEGTLISNRLLTAERVGTLWINMPPGFVWRYQLKEP